MGSKFPLSDVGVKKNFGFRQVIMLTAYMPDSKWLKRAPQKFYFGK